jgi:hypothetical protein
MTFKSKFLGTVVIRPFVISGVDRHSPPPEMWGSYYTGAQGWHRRICIEISVDGESVESVRAALKDAADAMEDAFLDLTFVDNYGDPDVKITARGHRKATSEEIVFIEQQQEAEKRKQQFDDEDDIERFKKRHPGLLK